MVYPLHCLVAIVAVDAETKTGAKVLITLQTRHIDNLAEESSGCESSLGEGFPPNPSSTSTAAATTAAATGGDAPLVNGITSLEIPGLGTEIYACLDDGTVFMWRRALGANMADWTSGGRLPMPVLAAAPVAHKAASSAALGAPGTGAATAITITATLAGSGSSGAAEIIVASSNSHGAVHIWRRASSTPPLTNNTSNTRSVKFLFSGVQVMQFARASTPHSLHLMSFDTTHAHASTADSSVPPLPGGAASSTIIGSRSAGLSRTLLLAGSVDSRIHIATTASGLPFSMAGTLPGHEEWVTCIASRPIPSVATIAGADADADATASASARASGGGSGSDSGSGAGDRTFTSMVATGSKDMKIRVWRFQADYNSCCSAATDTDSKGDVGTSMSEISAGSAGAIELVDDGEDGEDLDNEGGEGRGGGGGGGGGSSTGGGGAGSSYVVDEEDLIGAHEARLVFSMPGGSSCSGSGEGAEGGAASSASGVWSCAVYLETLLVGHEDWISSLVWLPPQPPQPPAAVDVGTCEGSSSTLQLFSTSMDRNMIMWEGTSAATMAGISVAGTTSTASEGTTSAAAVTAAAVAAATAGIWLPVCRIGDVGGMLGGSVGGNLLGFTAACMPTDGSAILGIGYGGSFHLYVRDKTSAAAASVVAGNGSSSSSSTYKARERWLSKPFLSGHFDAVADLCWASDGSYLVSVSADQSTRLWSTITRTASSSNGKSGYVGNWAEISRPQIHGYNLTCLALAPKANSALQTSDTGRANGTDVGGSSKGPLKLSVTAATAGTNETATVTTEISDTSYLLYSAGDEKMIRVFDAPDVVLEGISTLCCPTADTDTDTALGTANTASATSATSSRIRNAYIPELGLTNRAANLMNGTEKAEQLSRGTCDVSWISGAPPLEGQLADLTVWPEVKKLFGHTNDIVCMTLSESGKYLATACKARNAQTAAILLWDTGTMSIVGTLLGHDSTVSCLAFSSDGQFLASSGKDRSLCLYEKSMDKSDSCVDAMPYIPYAVQKGAHKRIVWDLSWTTSMSSKDIINTFLLSGSRDGVCKVWQVERDLPVETRAGKALVCLYSFSPFGGVSVTAVQFRWRNHIGHKDNGSGNSLENSSSGISSNMVLKAVVGSEMGDIHVWNLSATGSSNGSEVRITGQHHHSIAFGASHGAAVKRMRFGGEKNHLLATCGQDNTVRIFKLAVEENS